MSKHRIETDCIHAGYSPKNGEPRAIPIIQSTTFKYDSSEEMGRLFDLESQGYFYTRLQNPTNDAVAAKIAALEGGVGAALTSSGQAATFYAVFNLCEAGGHIVSSSAVYGGTYNLFAVTLKKLGIAVTFVDPDAPAAEIEAAFRPETRALFAETLANPSLVVLNIAKFASIAHEMGVPLIVDNTFPTPVNCRPIDFGADIVIHSTSKYMDGHAVALGGAVVDSGRFDWAASGKFPGLTKPDASYHGTVYTNTFGSAAYINKLVLQLMRDLGSVPSPFNSFLLGVGLETLALRVERHCANALAAARFLEGHPKVSFVNYPGLESNPYYALARQYLPKGTCGVISFGVKGGRQAAVRFMDALKLISIATHVADSKTCVLHPAGTTHRQLSAEELALCGIGEDMVRLSVGIEHIDDLVADLAQALDA